MLPRRPPPCACWPLCSCPGGGSGAHPWASSPFLPEPVPCQGCSPGRAQSWFPSGTLVSRLLREGGGQDCWSRWRVRKPLSDTRSSSAPPLPQPRVQPRTWLSTSLVLHWQRFFSLKRKENEVQAVLSLQFYCITQIHGVPPRGCPWETSM